VERFDVGVIFGFGQDASDDPPLLGDPQAAFGAQGFEIDGLVQGRPIQ
jgi:hypothetical protein